MHGTSHVDQYKRKLEGEGDVIPYSRRESDHSILPTPLQHESKDVHSFRSWIID